MTEAKMTRLIEWSRGIATKWGRVALARYEERFGGDPTSDNIGGWDEDVWGECWKEIRDTDREGGENDIESMSDDDVDILHTEARQAFDEEFLGVRATPPAS